MNSDSDDEPLSAIAAKKDGTEYNDSERIKKKKSDIKFNKKVSKKKLRKRKTPGKFSEITNFSNIISPTEIQRPMDVWLYMKDLNPTGPYSCLLCSEWFINRSKLIIHYVLNHKKDYCGICRYFVTDRDAWDLHMKFHIPWNCSQCTETFETENELRKHFSDEHRSVHCRLCYFMMSDDNEYHSHLFQKHNVSNVANRDKEVLWELEYDGSPKFMCLLCSKSNNMVIDFFKHFMCYHHFTLKCFTALLSGHDYQFSVCGANITSTFLESQLKDHIRYGYVDPEQKTSDCDRSITTTVDPSDNVNLLEALIPEIKQEIDSDGDEIKIEIKSDVENNDNNDNEENKENGILNDYKGDEDFDVTLTELIILQKCYVEYVDMVLDALESNSVPKKSYINYQSISNFDINCCMCPSKYQNTGEFIIHMFKMHGVKSLPSYHCRVCVASFENENDLQTHISEELAEFEDLWLCQFCDKEFDNREDCREHLTDHWDSIGEDNCFSPHLGFKCRYCPSLFWNEPDRVSHQSRVHENKFREDFYQCVHCSELFSDQIWFIHHYYKKHLNSDEDCLILLKCNICAIVLNKVDDMRSHFNTEHPEARKIFCSLESCKFKPFSRNKSFKIHLKTLHNPNSKGKDAILNCSVCGREFANSKACGTHMTLAHGPGRFKCKLCQEILRSSDERKLHYLIQHPGRHPFECNICGKSFQYKSSLYVHRSDYHTKNKVTYKCSYCNKEFLKRDSFKEHVLIHEGPRHACSYCPMRFVQRSNMLRHERRHTGERPYTCVHCGRTFADKGACNSHMRTHSREEFHVCIYCGQSFAQKSKLKYHIRKHTGENLETCHVCSKLFTSVCSLREHMKTHEKKEKVQCPMCSREYMDERYMLRHLRTAHNSGSESFNCPLCRKSVTTLVGLRQHIMTHSKVKIFQCRCCAKSCSSKKTIVKHVRKRHGTRANIDTARLYYRMLDPRECNLGLNEDILTGIFGPPKKINTDVVIGDYVTFPKLKLPNDSNNKTASDNECDSSESDSRTFRRKSKTKESFSDENGNTGETKETENMSTEDKQSKTDRDRRPAKAVNYRDYDSNDSATESKSKKRKKQKPRKRENLDYSNLDDLEPTDFVTIKLEPVDDEEPYDQ